MATRRSYCSECETQQLCKVDPFNGAIICGLCGSYVGQDTTTGPVEKVAPNEDMPFAISNFPATKISTSNSYIETNISKKNKQRSYYLAYFSIFCVLLAVGFLTKVLLLSQQQPVLSTNEADTAKIVQNSEITTTPIIEEKQPQSIDLLKEIQSHRILLAKKLMPSVLLIIKNLPNQPQPIKMGTGFIFKENGYVLTNYHVISGNQGFIRAMLHDGRVVNCTVDSYDQISDIAILTIPNFHEIKSETAVVEWGNSNNLETGQTVLALGHPQGFQFSLVMGVISNPHAYLPVFSPDREEGNYGYFHDWIQIDASFHHGLSGGPLFDIDGKVIGINTRKSEYSGIGFCIPGEYAQRIVEHLIKYKQIVRSTLGIVWGEYWSETEEGAFVTKVLPLSSAEKAGIQKGDVILSIGGIELNAKRTSDLPRIRRIESELSLSEKVLIKLKRNQQYIDTFALAELRNPFHDNIMYFNQLKFWGIPISPTLQTYLKISYHTGVWIVDIDPDSPLVKTGMLAQDVIIGTKKYFIHSDEFIQFYKQLQHNTEVSLRVQRDNKLYSFKLWVP